MAAPHVFVCFVQTAVSVLRIELGDVSCFNRQILLCFIPLQSWWEYGIFRVVELCLVEEIHNILQPTTTTADESIRPCQGGQDQGQFLLLRPTPSSIPPTHNPLSRSLP